MSCFYCDQSLDELPECTCDGPGFCPVYKIRMDQHSYDKCKHDKVWRKNYTHFFGIVNHPEFKGQVEESPDYNTIEQHREKQAKYKANRQQQWVAHTKKENKHFYDNRYNHAFQRKYMVPAELKKFDSLSDEHKNEFLKTKWATIDRVQAEQAEHEQLDKVVESLEEAGVNLETYQDKRDGLGTVISNVLDKLGVTEDKIEEWSGIEGCGCEKRKKFLNKIFPFRKKEKSIG